MHNIFTEIYILIMLQYNPLLLKTYHLNYISVAIIVAMHFGFGGNVCKQFNLPYIYLNRLTIYTYTINWCIFENNNNNDNDKSNNNENNYNRNKINCNEDNNDNNDDNNIIMMIMIIII